VHAFIQISLQGISVVRCIDARFYPTAIARLNDQAQKDNKNCAGDQS
jgi:hypothetical protein